MHPKELRIADYTYDLPDERIAKYPLPERDEARLLVYKEGNIDENTYKNLAGQLPEGALLVFNQTRVVHARLLFRKATGGVIEVFCLSPHGEYADIQSAMLQKGSVRWASMVGGASKWKPGMALEKHHEGPDFTLFVKVVDRTLTAYVLQMDWDDPNLTFAEVLHYCGHVPLPPYLHREAEPVDETSYQTMFAKEEGSVAAPTASLHFTPAVVDSLEVKNIQTAFVTLHVGAGTFKPVKSATMEEHDMHAEWMEVSRDTLAVLMQQQGPVVAVGTTSLRTLESLYWIGCQLLGGHTPDFHGVAVGQWEPYEDKPAHSTAQALAAIQQYMEQQGLEKLITRTQIMIAPGYTFRMADALITNFHQPQSTLLLLVAALVGEDWRKVYAYAMEQGFRFLSYGDGSLLYGRQPRML